jgi:hypothetical protein
MAIAGGKYRITGLLEYKSDKFDQGRLIINH